MPTVEACAQKNYHVGVVVLDTSGVQQAALRGDAVCPAGAVLEPEVLDPVPHLGERGGG